MTMILYYLPKRLNRHELAMMSFDVYMSLTPSCLFSACQTERSECHLFFSFFQSAPQFVTCLAITTVGTTLSFEQN